MSVPVPVPPSSSSRRACPSALDGADVSSARPFASGRATIPTALLWAVIAFAGVAPAGLLGAGRAAAQEVPPDPQPTTTQAIAPGAEQDAGPGGRLAYPQGLPHPVMHYDPDDTPAERQVWDIAQDADRVVYIAGSHRGVQTFDGEHWLIVPLDTTRDGEALGTARSLTQGHDGRMYVGSNDDIGVLVPDATGRLRFESLLPALREADRPPDADGTGTVWFAGATDTDTYFQTQRALYRWDGEGLDVWRSDNTFHTAHIVDDRLFIRDFKRGLLELVGSTLRPVPGGDAFRNRSIHALLLHPSGGMMAVSGTDGAFLLSEEGATRTSIEADAVLRTTRVYGGTPIRFGTDQTLYALATLGRGVLIIDPAGTVLYHLRPGHELPDGVVNAVHRGVEGELWLGFNNEGVMRIGGLPSVEYFGERSGLRGQIEDVLTFGDDLYVGTGSGLFRLAPQPVGGMPPTDDPFQRVVGSSVVNDLLATRWGLAVDDLSRVWMLGADDKQTTIARRNARTMYAPAGLPNHLLLPDMRGGINVAQNRGTTWETTRLEDVEPPIQNFQEYDGELWAAADPHTILRFSLDDASSLNTARHLSVDPAIAVEGFGLTTVRGRLVLVSRAGLFAWDAATETFSRADALLPDGDGPVRAMAMTDTTAWLVSGTQLHRGQWQADAETFAWSVVSGLSFRDNESVRLHEAPDGSVWIGRGDDLLRHDPSLDTAPGAAPPVLIRRVIAGTDERVVWGSRTGEGAVLSLPYDRNDPLIQFAAPNFNAESPPMYRTRLVGHDADWSDWTRRSAVDFVGLRENTYRLEVQARTVDGIVSEPSQLTVVVAPPWYRTVWAYLAYLLTLAGVAAAVWQYRVAVRRRRVAEEQTSKTAEELQAEQQLNQSLKRANERLREINRMKEFFIANTSHELRTPLTNIIGFARVLQDDVPDGLAPHLQVIENNGYRLLYTLNAILDLAGLRAGTMEPVLEWSDIRTPVRSVAQEMKSDAASKSLVLDTQIPERPVFAYLDAHMLERIVRHLVDNAVKFTAEGSVSIRVWESDDRVGITVRDTGVGIDPSFVPDLFVGFEQESQGMSRSYEGSGIGLAVAGQFVDVLDGRIKVETKKGEGSTFTVTFPRRGPGSIDADRPPGSTETTVRSTPARSTV